MYEAREETMENVRVWGNHVEKLKELKKKKQKQEKVLYFTKSSNCG